MLPESFDRSVDRPLSSCLANDAGSFFGSTRTQVRFRSPSTGTTPASAPKSTFRYAAEATLAASSVMDAPELGSEMFAWNWVAPLPSVAPLEISVAPCATTNRYGLPDSPFTAPISSWRETSGDAAPVPSAPLPPPLHPAVARVSSATSASAWTLDSRWDTGTSGGRRRAPSVRNLLQVPAQLSAARRPAYAGW